MKIKECYTLMNFLLQHLKNDKLSYGVIKPGTITFIHHLNTISRLWNQAKASKINDDENYNVDSQKNG